MADLYRVVWTRGTGPTTASEPLPRDEAMRQFDGLREIQAAASRGVGRVRVIREADYQPALFGPQNAPGVYRGEVARRQGEVHYGFSVLPTACDQPDRDLPPQDRVSRLSSQVTCERCRAALFKQAGGSR